MAKVYKNVERIIAGLPGVQEEVQGAAEKIKARAEANAAVRRRTGKYSGAFEVRKGKVDRFVVNDHPAADFIEVGHFAEKADGTLGEFVPGQFNLARAIHESRK